VATPSSASASAPTPFERAQQRIPRVREAFAHHAAELARAFHAAGAAWPPRGVYLRALKFESQLELWAAPAPAPRPPRSSSAPTSPAPPARARPLAPADPPRVLVRTFPICAKSGVLGPKSRAGDRQVPEGRYLLDRFNHWSEHHLSLGISYPNAADRARARARAEGASPGGDIFIHGGCVTIGCLPIENDPIEALYVIAVIARGHGQTQLPVHVFPCRFDSDACATARREAVPAEDVLALWRVLEEVYLRFEATHVPPAVRVTAKGYQLPRTP
jgi:murein L,D-transpeptidase YafK